MGAVLQAEEFQHERVFDEVGSFFHDLPLTGEAADFLLVPAESKALVETAGNLALKLPDRPLVCRGFDFVKAALGGVIQGEQFDVVGPAESEVTGKFVHLLLAGQGGPLGFGQNPRRCPGFWQLTRS
jgi:hypothetical protein